MSNSRFHEERRTGIGGSDVAALFGKHFSLGPLELYYLKKGVVEAEPEPDNGPLFWGKELEPLIIKKFRLETGLQVDPWLRDDGGQAMIRSEKHSFMVAHIDGVIVDTDHVGEGEHRWIDTDQIVEAKSAGQYNASEFGEEGTDEIPDAYLLQCQHNMSVTGANKCHVPVLIGGNNYRQYLIERDEELIAKIVEVESKFWKEHVERDIPPEVGGRGFKSFVKKLYPESRGEVIEITQAALDEQAELYERILQLVMAKDRLESLKAEVDSLTAGIQFEMKDAPGIKLDTDRFTGKITWKQSKDRKVVDNKALVAELQESDPEIVAKYTSYKPGYRTFRVNVKPVEQ